MCDILYAELNIKRNCCVHYFTVSAGNNAAY